MTLTKRRIEILKKLATDKTTKEIAGELNISPKTVEYHRGCLYKITKKNSIVGLAVWAIEQGLVPIKFKEIDFSI